MGPFLILPVIIIAGIFMIGLILMEQKKVPQHIREMRLNVSMSDLVKKNQQFDKWNNNPFFRSGLRKIHAQLAMLNIYTLEEAKYIALRFYKKNLLLLVGVPLIGLIAYQDLFTSLLIFVFTLVYKTTVVDNKLDKEHYKMLNQLSVTLSSIRQTYLREGEVPEAIASAEIKPYVQRPMMAIYNILQGTEVKSNLEKFLRSTPYRTIQTFATVAYLIHTTGDAKTDKGIPAFIDALDMMEAEIRLEIRRLRSIKAKFGVLTLLPILPLVAIRGVEWFFMSNIPGTALIYNGPLGYFIKVAIAVAGLIGYMAITKMTTGLNTRVDDRQGIANELLSNSSYADLIETIKPKRVLKTEKIKKSINEAMSMMTREVLYSKKLLTAIVLGISTIFVFIFANQLGKQYIYNSVQTASLIAGKPLTQEDMVIRKQMDIEYLKFKKRPSENDTQRFVAAWLPHLKHIDQGDQVQRLLYKYETYHNIRFRFEYILIAYAITILGWFAPNIGLKWRAWVLRTEADEDVLQLQTLLAILMNTNIDTLDALYWMTKISKVHKKLLMDCYHEYPSDPQLALRQLKRKVNIPDFHRLIDRLILTIHAITLREAFGELNAEREHLLKMRETAQDESLSKKRLLASPLAQAPLYMLAILYIVVPLFILGIREFTAALSNI